MGVPLNPRVRGQANTESHDLKEVPIEPHLPLNQLHLRLNYFNAPLSYKLMLLSSAHGVVKRYTSTTYTLTVNHML